MSSHSTVELKELLLRRMPLIDVRAPIEFALGTLPGAVNLPIMNDRERTAVGTAYKQAGPAEALRLGHELVSGDVKEERIQAWSEYIRCHPDAVLFCFRGGLRSQITQRWLAERGIERPLIQGGYKKGRLLLREELQRFSLQPLLILSGPTGSGKTHLLNKAAGFYPSLDLEALACHRGSAFGGISENQPAQINFENAISVSLMELELGLERSKVLVEDESRLIGRCAIPESFFLRMRSSDLLYVEESFEQRVENIFQEYVVQTAIGKGTPADAAMQFDKFRKATAMISRKLGGARSQEVACDIDQAQQEYVKNNRNLEANKSWISKLLGYYYDPSYSQSLSKRNPHILVRGSANDILQYLHTHIQPNR